MDVLSDVIGVMRTGKPHSSRSEHHQPWEARFPPSESAGFHVVLQGGCLVVPELGAPIRLGVGDVVLMPGETGYQLIGPGRTGEIREAAEYPTVLLCGAYLLDQGRPHPLLTELPACLHLPAHLGRHSELRTAVELLGGELERPGAGSEAVISALLDMLLLYILRAWLDERREQDGFVGWAAALSDPGIANALGGIHREPERPWTVEELGAVAGLSRAAFARRFAALVGLSPLAYLTWWRMVTAARFLRDPSLPLRTVAVRVGYTSEFAFAKAFKREYGRSPGEYRRASTIVRQ